MIDSSQEPKFTVLSSRLSVTAARFEFVQFVTTPELLGILSEILLRSFGLNHFSNERSMLLCVDLFQPIRRYSDIFELVEGLKNTHGKLSFTSSH